MESPRPLVNITLLFKYDPLLPPLHALTIIFYKYNNFYLNMTNIFSDKFKKKFEKNHQKK